MSSTNSRPGVEVADVARGHQAGDPLLVAGARVALELHRVPDEDPTRRPLRQLVPIGVKDLHDRSAHDLPDAPRLGLTSPLRARLIRPLLDSVMPSDPTRRRRRDD
jgi:hypothetical protein